MTRLAGTHNIPGLPSDAWLEYLSWEPPIAVFHNFLTMEEADALVAKVRKCPSATASPCHQAMGFPPSLAARTHWQKEWNTAATCSTIATCIATAGETDHEEGPRGRPQDGRIDR